MATQKKNKRASKKPAKTVQRSVYWNPSLVNRVERDRQGTHRSWSAHAAWIVESYLANQEAAR